MNRFEYLYHKKQLLEKKIAKNDLFKLGTKDAIQCVMIKVGMLYSFFTVGDYNKKQQYMKKLIKTNATDIDEITFFQESLKWICRLPCLTNGSSRHPILALSMKKITGLQSRKN